MAALKQRLIDLYDENDKNYSEKAMAQIDEYFSKMKKSSSPIDPERLGSRSTFTSRLKMALIEKVGPIEVDGHPKFNELSVKDQIKFQKRALLTGLEDWVHDVEIVPANLAGLKMPEDLSAKLKEMREAVNNDKLEQEMLEVDADRMLAKLCPHLWQSEPKRHHLAAALLAVTGRRTIEILKLGKLYLGPDQTPDGYSCWFDGSAKQGINPTKPYEIPLLAPFSLVKAALTRVREMYDTEDITEATVNSNLSKSISNYTQKEVGVNPHSLRSIYAMATYKLLKKKISLIGHIRKVLGHSDGTSASHYQRLDVTITDVWTPPAGVKVDVPAKEVQPKEENGPAKGMAFAPVDEFDGWVINGAVEKKRFEGIRDMMVSRLKLTATAIRAKVGGTIPVLQRILDNNAAKVEEYNSSLTEEETKRIRRA